MKRLMAVCMVAAVSIAVLAGCSSESESGPVATTDESVAEWSPVDITPGLQALFGKDDSIITSAEEIEKGRYEVATTIVDPRSGEGSDEAKLAIEVCEAVLAEYGDGVYVNVTEADGTSFVLANHPMTGPECTEY